MAPVTRVITALQCIFLGFKLHVNLGNLDWSGSVSEGPFVFEITKVDYYLDEK